MWLVGLVKDCGGEGKVKYVITILALVGGLILSFKFFEAVDWYWWQEGLAGLFIGVFITNQAVTYAREVK